MSASQYLSPLPKAWSNVNTNSISTKSANLNFGGITNVSTINGNPIPPFGVDPNVANVIYKPGSSPAAYENIVNSWAQVVAKANQLNINQCLNVYIDSSIVSPALIDASLDCKSRVRFLCAEFNISTPCMCRISDGVILTNPGEISTAVQMECESLTGPNIALTNGALLICREGAQLKNTLTSLVPSIQIGDGNGNVISCAEGSIIGTQTGNSLINVGIGSTLIFSIQTNSSGQMFVANTISSTDGTATLYVGIDSSVLASSVVNAGYTGSVTVASIDNAASIKYNDSVLPAFGSTDVQGALDYIKGNYAKSNSSDPFTCGDLSCSSLSDSGTASITGACSVGSLSSSGDINCTRIITGDGSFGNPAIQFNTSATGFWNVNPNTIGLAMNGIIWAYFGIGGGFSGLFAGNPGMELGNSGNYWETLWANNVNTGTLSATGSVNLGRGTVTQLISNATSVTLNSSSGVITMFGALAANTTATFTVNNDKVSSNSVITISCGMAGQNSVDAGTSFTVYVNNVQNGSFSVQARNMAALTAATNPLTISFICA